MADATTAERPARTGVGAVRADFASSRSAWIGASAAMMAVLLLPAIWNGFPLIFPDTGGYLLRPIEGTLTIGRSALYGLFLYAGVPLAFWPNVVLQSALIVWLIVLTLRVLGLADTPWPAVGTVAVLSVGTSLPWFTGQLMPDVLFPAAVLALYLMLFHLPRLRPWEAAGLVVTVAVAIPGHMAAAGLCVGVLAALFVLTRAPLLALPSPRLWLATGAVAAGIALCPLSNALITGQAAFTPGGTSFLFGRLIEDGVIARYLDDRCPDPSLQLCSYRDDLPDDADEWLWDHSSPFQKVGGWAGFAAEQRRIILDTLARYPLMHLQTATMAVLDQLAAFRTEVSIDDNEPTLDTIADDLPALAPTLMHARQQAAPFDIAPLNFIHVPVAGAAMAGLVLLLVFRRRLTLAPEFTALAATVLLALVVNAAICGIFSHAVDRYQSRLAPLAVLALAAWGIRQARAHHESATPGRT